MRLESIKVHGFRRLADTGCFLSGKLTAFVGPNEAGKSSLLDALMSTNDPSEVPLRDRPRGREVSDRDRCLELRFRLEADDVAALSGVTAVETAVWFHFTLNYGGNIVYETEPRLSRPQVQRTKAAAALQRYSGTQAARELERSADADGPGNMLDSVGGLVALDDDLDQNQVQLTQELAGILEKLPGLAARTATALSDWLLEQEPDDPHAVATAILFERRPRFAWFGDAERTLASDYHLPDVVADPPAALRNLAQLAELDLQRLSQAVAGDDVGLVESMTEAANVRLRSVFEYAWSQAPVFVRLKQDAQTLRILVSVEGGGYSSIAERSDGLKTFVALTAFGALRGPTDRRLILVIDEAEQHLHYDAQADLIRMLDRQEVAAQVIYTTHSAGCLPLDLGTGIRPVLPHSDRPGTSRLANNFWTESPGFTPLLMAMGAAAAAFTPSRYAVLTEGVTEMLLLPTLLREATGRDRLDYQVAPGIAEATTDQLEALDLEAARVAYMVDGDDGGTAHAKRLATVGVPATKIIRLGGTKSDLSLEDLLRVDVYLAAVNEALLRKHGAARRMVVSDLLENVPRTKSVDGWCNKHALEPISKSSVVAALLETRSDRLLTKEGAKVLRTVHAALCAALGLPA